MYVNKRVLFNKISMACFRIKVKLSGEEQFVELNERESDDCSIFIKKGWCCVSSP